MAHIYQRGKTWWVKFYANGKPIYRSLGVTDEADAAVIKAEIERQQRRGFAPIVHSVQTVADALKSFLKDKKLQTERATWRTYEKHARAIRDLFPCFKRMAEVTSQDVRDYMGRRAKSVGPRTVNHERTTLSVLWNWAMREEPPLADRNPVLATRPLPLRAQPAKEAPAELVAAYVAALRADAARRPDPVERWLCDVTADAVEVLWWTGWRMGELCGLKLEDVNASTWTCPLRSAWNKGNRDECPIPPEVVPIFEKRLALKQTYVFAAFRGGYAYSAIYKFRCKWLKEHPEHRRAKFHGLRHAMASDLKRSGVDPHTRQGLTRHATQAMLGHYTHDDLGALREAQARLAAWRKDRPK